MGATRVISTDGNPEVVDLASLRRELQEAPLRREVQQEASLRREVQRASLRREAQHGEDTVDGFLLL